MADQQMQPAPRPKGGFGALWRFLPMLWPKGDTELARVSSSRWCSFSPARRSDSSDPMRSRRCRPDDGPRGVRRRRRPGAGLCRRALRRRPVRQSAQRDVREGRPGCRTAARRQGLPPRPRSVAALPPRAAHRVADQDRRARHQEHRHDALFPPVQHRPDGDRAGRHLRHLLREVRRRPGRRDAGDGGHLHRLHPQGDRLALRHSAADERRRQQRDRPRGQFAAQLRDGQIFRRRGPRGEALRRGRRRLRRASVRNEISLAWLNIGQSLITNLMMAGAMMLHRLGLEPGRFSAGDVVWSTAC